MLIFALALSLTGQDMPQEMRLMRFPAIHGDQIVFTYAGDLWTSDRSNGFARRLTSHPNLEAYARFSRDGKWIAFTGTYDGDPDVYVMPAEGGEPKRLTFDPGPDIVRDWTPDGKIAYLSGGTPGGFSPGLKLVDMEGGFPKDTKLDEVSDLSFSPDGKKIAFNRQNSHNFNWRRYRGGTQGRISFSDTEASYYKEIPSKRDNAWQPMWIGNDVYYISDEKLNTRNFYRYDTNSGKSEQVTQFADADIKWPSSDDKRIIYERDGKLYTFEVATKKVDQLNPMLRSDMVSARPQLRKLAAWVSGFSLSPSGARLAIEARGELFSVPAKTGDTRHLGAGSASKEWGPAWSPDGQKIAFMSDKSGENRIYTMPQQGGDWTEIKTNAAHRIQAFRWSPDSKSISYSTVTRELFICDPMTGRAEQVFQDEFNYTDGNYDWSPDSKWIAFLKTGKNLNLAVHLYEVATKKATQITEGYYRDDSISFDLNGKYLYLVSARTINPTFGDFDFTMETSNAQRVYVIPLAKDTPNPLIQSSDEEPEPKPTPPAGGPPAGGPPAGGPPAGGPPPAAPKVPDMKVDLEGMGARAIPLPYGAGAYAFVVGADNGVFTWAGGRLMRFDLGARQSADIIAGASGFDWNPRRTKMAYQAGPNIGVVDVRPGNEPGSGRVNMNDVEAVIDPKAEWKQIYWEAWRWERDRFYDSNMLGLNWNAIGKQYENYLPYVGHRSDLSYVLALMIGELGTGHAYVSGGDPGVTAPMIPTGTLGADYELANGHVKFAKIFRGLNFEEGRRGPLGEPGIEVKEGEYLLAVDGQEVGTRSPNQFLIGKVNRFVTLTVNSAPTMSGSRKIRVRPTSSEDQLRYIEWVEDNRRKVNEMSGGKIGYLHVPNTSTQGVIEFVKGFYGQTDKQALIVDERYNGGGMIPTFFIEKLQRRFVTAFRQRNGGDVPFPPQAIDGPMAMLINEYAGSGGDLFPYYFKQAKLGPLIGNRTWGGLVGITGGAPLVDGGQVTAPEFGLYDPITGEWIAENKGIDPDIAIDARPDLRAQGKDPQLEKAVEYLLNELKKGTKTFKRPDFPKVKVGGRDGNVP